MSTTYTIRSGDTLGKIAAKFYEDSALAFALAGYNGIVNAHAIVAGHRIEVPSRAELEGRTVADRKVEVVRRGGIQTPNGLTEIIDVFGDPFPHIRPDSTIDGAWWSSIKGSAVLPRPLPLSWALSQTVTTFACHRKLSGLFTDVFAAIEQEGLWKHLHTFGGCYNYRVKRGGTALSTHTWAIAVDVNPSTNRMGTPGDLHEGVVEIFRKHGFKWGGDWKGKNKDPMHFQFCTGY